MGTCRYCERSGKTISDVIGFCADCIRNHFSVVWPEIAKVHARSRKAYGLPVEPPRDPQGISCRICFNRCRIPEGQAGFCGLRYVSNGKLKGGRPHEGNLSYYYDPLPTNCVADFVCAAGTGCGYPRYSHVDGPEYGYRNLAVFYNACAFNCLYCQNYQFKERTFSPGKLHARDLAKAVDDTTSCICYFGGDPGPQILHAIKAARLALKKSGDQILRICWETNGSVNQPYLDMMAELSLQSGGCIKFDLKAWDEGLHKAMCGVTNRKTLDNFKVLSKWISQRPDPPFLIASTLLVPGYVDEQEVEGIARYISALNPNIPYSLLGFYPQFYLNDLPTTSRRHAMRCQQIAQSAGLRRIHIGNAHMLGEDYW
ncbi:MAG: pyruvate formate lyase-activating protein [Desulfobacterales bacterium S5133MH4]|nr:MAG: pyruvate formate lyase-activating protein [Desulfobacterales bacterium S5133MH4]